MHNPSVYRHIRDAARTTGAAMLAYRIADVVDAIDVPPYVWFAMLPFFVASIGVAAWASYRLRVHQAELDKEAAECRAEIAELEAARLRRQERREQEAEDAEWARWWAEAREHDTIAFGTTVVSLQAHRGNHQPRAAG